MTYHTLVERDSNNISGHWKWLTVLTLALIAGLSFTSTFIFHSFLENFKSNCVIDVKLSLERMPLQLQEKLANTNEENNGPTKNIENQLEGDYVKRLKQYFVKFRTFYNKSTEKEEPQSNQRTNFYKIFNANGEKVESDRIKQSRNPLMYEHDVDYFENKRLDEHYTRWGSISTCDYFNYAPLMEAIIAVIWIVFFLMCGYGGKKTGSFLDEPWRIVLPALVCFIILTISSFFYSGFLTTKLNAFCINFRSIFKNKDIPCGLLFNRYRLDDYYRTTTFLPSVNYLLCIIFAWFISVLWMVTVIVMLLRFTRGSDFQTVNLSISSPISNMKCPTTTDSLDGNDGKMIKCVEINPDEKLKFIDEHRQFILIPNIEVDNNINSTSTAATVNNDNNINNILRHSQYDEIDDQHDENCINETSLTQ